MKDNACPLPPNNNGKGEQWAEKRERGEKAGLEREEKSPSSVIGPDFLLCGLLSYQSTERKGTEFIKVRSSESVNAGDPSSIPGSGRFSGKGNSYPLQYCALENSMDCIVHEVAKSRTRLRDFHFQGVQEVTEIQSQWEVRASCHSSWNPWSLVDRLCSMTCMYISDPPMLMRCIMHQQQWTQALNFLVRQITFQTVLRHLRCLVFFHSFLSNCLSLMGKSTAWFSFSEKSSK